MSVKGQLCVASSVVSVDHRLICCSVHLGQARLSLWWRLYCRYWAMMLKCSVIVVPMLTQHCVCGSPLYPSFLAYSLSSRNGQHNRCSWSYIAGRWSKNDLLYQYCTCVVFVLSLLLYASILLGHARQEDWRNVMFFWCWQNVVYLNFSTRNKFIVEGESILKIDPVFQV